MRARGPDFIGIGAQKCATTFVYERLRRHPQIDFPAKPERLVRPPVELEGREIVTWPKEIRFLHGQNDVLSWADYLRLFDGKEAGVRYGEITPFYLVAPRHRIEELRRHVPGVRLFAILRDPVERDWSSIRMVAERQGALADPAGLRRIAESRPIRIRGDYVSSLGNWLAVFPREQLLVLPYELLKRDHVAFLGAICGHLGVSVDPIASAPNDVVFAGPEARMPPELLASLVERHEGVAAELERLTGVPFGEYWSDGARA